MPFIKKEDREKMNKKYLGDFCYYDDIVDINVGDRCYYFYKEMVETFKHSKRWTTAHNIYKEMIQRIKDNQEEYSTDTKRAYELAWQVFFQLHVMPYELEKKKENGDVG